MLLLLLIAGIMVFLWILYKHPDETLDFIGITLTASLLGGIIWLFIKYTKICLLVLLFAVIAVGIIMLIIFLCSSFDLDDFRGVTGDERSKDREMKSDIKKIKSRIKKNRSHCIGDPLIQNDADKLLVIANNLYIAVSKTPASKHKSCFIIPEIQRLNSVVELLEELNVKSAITDASHLIDTRKDLENQIKALIDMVDDIFNKKQ